MALENYKCPHGGHASGSADRLHGAFRALLAREACPPELVTLLEETISARFEAGASERAATAARARHQLERLGAARQRPSSGAATREGRRMKNTLDDLAGSCSLERLVRLRVLVACEYSGTVRDAFIRAGYDAMSCDLLPTEKDGPHYQGDVRDVLADGWDMMIAHPTCTYMANSGVCWLHKDPTRWAKLDDGAAFFRLLWDAPIPRIALENPVMHKYAKERIGGLKQSQTIQPWMFGHMESKATCLWLRGLPPLVPTNNVKDEMMKLPDNQRQRLHYLPPGPDRWKERSRTYAGIAEAMASQWGAYCMANAHADLPAVAGKVRRVVGNSGDVP